MKKINLRTLILTCVLGVAVFAVVLPISIPKPVSVPIKPASTEVPTGENGIEPLSDLEEKKLH